MAIAFINILNTTEPHYISTDDALKRIKNGKSKDAILRIRDSKDKKERTELKKMLPSMAFSADEVVGIEKNGKKSFRLDESVVKHSSYMMFDVDGIDNPNEFRDELKSNDYVYSAWVSPSGNGVNFLVKVVPNIDMHKNYYASFLNEHKSYNCDSSTSNVLRIKFESFDEDLWINKKSKTWDKLLSIKEKSKSSPVKSEPIVSDWEKVNLALSKIDRSHDGEKMKVLLQISELFGGWVSARDIDQHTAVSLLREAILKKDIDDERVAFKAIDDAVEHGKLAPIHMFKERDLLEMKVGLDKLYVHYDDVEDKVKEFYVNGYLKGESPGWGNSFEYMSFLKGAMTTVYAQPYSGKSQFMHEVYVNIAATKGWKFALMSSETGSVEQIFGELISIYVGKSFIGDFKMSALEADKASKFVREHFYIIEPDGKALTIEGVVNQAKGMEHEYGVHIDCISIDPLNMIKFETGKTNGREDISIGFDLDFLIADSRINDRHNVIITHVKDQAIRSNDNNQMYYPVPSPREIRSGQIFYQKGFQMICVYRPLDTKGNPLTDDNGVPFQKNETHIYVSKSKPKGIGKQGMFKLMYDWRKNQYYEDVHGEMIYSPKTKKEDVTQLTIDTDSEQDEQALQPNEDFNAAPF